MKEVEKWDFLHRHKTIIWLYSTHYKTKIKNSFWCSIHEALKGGKLEPQWDNTTHLLEWKIYVKYIKLQNEDL